MILGSKHFVEKIRKKYVGLKPDPQQRKVTKGIDSTSYLRKGEQIFGCNVEHFVDAKRLSGDEKEIQNLLLNGIWKTGQLKNRRAIRVELFRSQPLRKISKLKLARSRQLQAKFEQLNSFFNS